MTYACLAALLPCLAVAGAEPNGDMALGELEAIAHFCNQVNPALTGESLLHLLGEHLAPGSRDSSEYKQGYDLASDALARIERQKAVAGCASLSIRKGSDDDDDGDDHHHHR